MFETYRPSGKFGAMTMPLWLLALVVTVPLSIAYVVLLEVIPLIYVSVILTLVAGWLLGLAAYFACKWGACLLYTSPSPRDGLLSRMPSSA